MDKEIEQQIHEIYEFAEKMYKKGYNKGYEDRDSNLQEMYEKGLNDNKNELLDYVTESIEAEKKMIGSCHDLASEDYHKGIIYAFECMKMKLN